VDDLLFSLTFKKDPPGHGLFHIGDVVPKAFDKPLTSELFKMLYRCAECKGEGIVLGIGGREVVCGSCDGPSPYWQFMNSNPLES
jgi:hypothetical protein